MKLKLSRAYFALAIIPILLIGIGISMSQPQPQINPFAESHIFQHLLISWDNSNLACNSQARYEVIDYAGNSTNLSKGKCIGLLLSVEASNLAQSLNFVKQNSKKLDAVIFDDYSLQNTAFDLLYSNFSSILPVIPVEYCVQYCINWLGNAEQYSKSVIFAIGNYGDFILSQSNSAQTWNASIVSDALHLHYQNIFILVYESGTSFQKQWSQNYINGTILASEKFSGLVVWNGNQF